jgi:N-methylhydantoinase A
MRQDFVQTINATLSGLDIESLTRFMQDHIDSGYATLEAAKTRFESRDVTFTLDMSYLGQTHTVSVPLDVTVTDGVVQQVTHDDIGKAFDAAYLGTYDRILKGGTRRVINLRTAVTGRRPRFDLSTLAPVGGSVETARIATRKVHFGDTWHDTAIYNRLSLPVGARIPGPAILEQPDTTVLIEPNLTGVIDELGNTIIERSGR